MIFPKKKSKQVVLDHYAPDVNITPLDYLELDIDQRVKVSTKSIEEFLSYTYPDTYNDTFWDLYTDREDQLLITKLKQQYDKHNEANQEIIMKHKGELERLDSELRNKETILHQIEEELKCTIEKFNERNGR